MGKHAASNSSPFEWLTSNEDYPEGMHVTVTLRGIVSNSRNYDYMIGRRAPYIFLRQADMRVEEES